MALVCGTAGCVSAGVPKPASDQQEPDGWTRQERVLRSIGGMTRVERWHAAGEAAPRVIKVERYVSGMALVKGARLIFHREQRRWMLSLDEHLRPLESVALTEPYPPLPLGIQGTVIWQGAFEHGGIPWQLAIFKMSFPQELPGVANETEESLDLLMWRSDVEPERATRQ